MSLLEYNFIKKGRVNGTKLVLESKLEAGKDKEYEIE